MILLDDSLPFLSVYCLCLTFHHFFFFFFVMTKVKQEEIEFEEGEFEFDEQEEEYPLEGEEAVLEEADPKEKQRLQRKEQKEQTLKRKLQKPNSELIMEAKNIWEQLRQKRLSKQERRELMDQMMKLVSGKVLEVSQIDVDYLQARCESYCTMLCQVWITRTTRRNCERIKG
jgi:type III secretory pathway component EscV